MQRYAVPEVVQKQMVGIETFFLFANFLLLDGNEFCCTKHASHTVNEQRLKGNILHIFLNGRFDFKSSFKKQIGL